MDLLQVLEMGEEVHKALDTQNEEELQLVKEICSVRKEIKNIEDQWAADIKDTIAAKLSEDDTEDEEEMKAEAEQLAADCEAMKTEQCAVEKECQSFKKNVQMTQQQQQQLRQERLALKETSSASLSKYRYDANLFTKISRISWQCNCADDEVQGYICTKSDVKPFSLSKGKVSLLFITNHLWDLIEDEGW